MESVHFVETKSVKLLTQEGGHLQFISLGKKSAHVQVKQSVHLPEVGSAGLLVQGSVHSLGPKSAGASVHSPGSRKAVILGLILGPEWGAKTEAREAPASAQVQMPK